MAAHPGAVKKIDDDALQKCLMDYIEGVPDEQDVWPFGAYWDLDFQNGTDYEQMLKLQGLVLHMARLQPTLRFQPVQLRQAFQIVLPDHPRAGDAKLPHHLQALKLSRRFMVIAYHLRRCMSKSLPMAPHRGVESTTWSQYLNLVGKLTGEDKAPATAKADEMARKIPRRLKVDISACSSFGPSMSDGGEADGLGDDDVGNSADTSDVEPTMDMAQWLDQVVVVMVVVVVVGRGGGGW